MNKLDINLNLYRSFYYVAKYSGFTKASIHTNISQSSLSSNVKNLEELLDNKLFERNLTAVSLTSYGRDLYLKLEEVKSILNDESSHSELKIGCTRFIADNYLANSITAFKKINSNVKLSFNFSNATDMFQMLKKDELDIIVCRYPLFFKFENYIQVEKLFDAENVFACSKKFYNQKELKKKDYIYPMILPDSSEKRRTIEQYLIDNNVNYSIEIEIPNSTLLKKLILNDMGVGYINKKYVENEIENGLIMILENFRNMPTDSIAIVFNSRSKNKLLFDYINILKDNIKKNDN